jgi:hypothetical protein
MYCKGIVMISAQSLPRRLRGRYPHGTAHATAGACSFSKPQQAFLNARHHHDLSLPGAFGAGYPGPLSDPDHVDYEWLAAKLKREEAASV